MRTSLPHSPHVRSLSSVGLRPQPLTKAEIERQGARDNLIRRALAQKQLPTDKKFLSQVRTHLANPEALKDLYIELGEIQAQLGRIKKGNGSTRREKANREPGLKAKQESLSNQIQQMKLAKPAVLQAINERTTNIYKWAFDLESAEKANEVFKNARDAFQKAPQKRTPEDYQHINDYDDQIRLRHFFDPHINEIIDTPTGKSTKLGESIRKGDPGIFGDFALHLGCEHLSRLLFTPIFDTHGTA